MIWIYLGFEMIILCECSMPWKIWTTTTGKTSKTIRHARSHGRLQTFNQFDQETENNEKAIYFDSKNIKQRESRLLLTSQVLLDVIDRRRNSKTRIFTWCVHCLMTSAGFWTLDFGQKHWAYAWSADYHMTVVLVPPGCQAS